MRGDRAIEKAFGYLRRKSLQGQGEPCREAHSYSADRVDTSSFWKTLKRDKMGPNSKARAYPSKPCLCVTLARELRATAFYTKAAPLIYTKAAPQIYTKPL